MCGEKGGMAMKKEEDYKVVLPLDEFDAVCDEFLKAFEKVDVKQLGVIDASGFQSFKCLLLGGNVTSLFGRFGQNRRATWSTVDNAGQAMNGEMSAEVCAVDAVREVNTGALSDPAFALFCQKRKALLEMPFEAVDDAGEGVIEACQILMAVGLDSAVGYLRSVYGPETKITDALWPAEGMIIDGREAVDIAPMEDETHFEEDLHYALSSYLPGDSDLTEDCQLETA